MIFATPLTQNLASRVARASGQTMGKVLFRTFPDGERSVRIVSKVHGRHVVAIGTTPSPAENLLDMLFLIRALSLAGARRVTAVLPYLSYSRGDRVTVEGELAPIKLVAELIEAAGASEVIILDPHSAATERSFHIPVTVLSALPVLSKKIPANSETLVVAPDRGATRRALEMASLFGSKKIISFRKQRSHTGKITSMPVGKIPRSRRAVLVDDLVSTGGTAIAAVSHLRKHGIRDIAVAVTHPVFSSNAIRKMRKAGVNRIVVADTIPPREKNIGKIVRVVSVAQRIARAL